MSASENRANALGKAKTISNGAERAKKRADIRDLGVKSHDVGINEWLRYSVMSCSGYP